MAYVHSPHWDTDGDEGDVVRGGLAVVDAVDGVAVVAVHLAPDDLGPEGNGWKVGQHWVQETFGLEMWACLSAHA